MAVSDSGVWKLFIFAVAFILIVGGVMALVLEPFVENNIPIPNTGSTGTLINGVSNYINGQFNLTLSLNLPIIGSYNLTGALFSPFSLLGSDGQQYLANSFMGLIYLPVIIQIPILILLILSFGYVVYVLITMLIP